MSDTCIPTSKEDHAVISNYFDLANNFPVDPKIQPIIDNIGCTFEEFNSLQIDFNGEPTVAIPVEELGDVLDIYSELYDLVGNESTDPNDKNEFVSTMIKYTELLLSAEQKVTQIEGGMPRTIEKKPTTTLDTSTQTKQVHNEIAIESPEITLLSPLVHAGVVYLSLQLPTSSYGPFFVATYFTPSSKIAGVLTNAVVGTTVSITNAMANRLISAGTQANDSIGLSNKIKKLGHWTGKAVALIALGIGLYSFLKNLEKSLQSVNYSAGTVKENVVGISIFILKVIFGILKSICRLSIRQFFTSFWDALGGMPFLKGHCNITEPGYVETFGQEYLPWIESATQVASAYPMATCVTDTTIDILTMFHRDIMYMHKDLSIPLTIVFGAIDYVFNFNTKLSPYSNKFKNFPKKILKSTVDTLYGNEISVGGYTRKQHKKNKRHKKQSRISSRKRKLTRSRKRKSIHRKQNKGKKRKHTTRKKRRN